VAEDVLPRYPSALPGLLNIGLLHSSADGSPEHESYAPCSLPDLVAKGYQYWALGHVHRRSVLSEGPSWVVFPGNPQGRHAKETGPKGVTLVTVDEEEIIDVEAVTTDVARFAAIQVSLEEDDDLDALFEKARDAMTAALQEAEGRLLAARLRVVGRSAAHREVIGRREEVFAHLKAVALDLAEDLWLEKTILQTSPVVPFEKLREGSGLVASVLRGVSGLRADPAAAKALLEEVLGPIARSAGAELEALKLTQSTDDLLAQVEALLAVRLEEGAAP
jgi:DNA repair exonuclease SbcCD nuclease subunit